MLVEAEAAQEAIELTRARRAARCACLPHRPAAPPGGAHAGRLHARASQVTSAAGSDQPPRRPGGRGHRRPSACARRRCPTATWCCACWPSAASAWWAAPAVRARAHAEERQPTWPTGPAWPWRAAAALPVGLARPRWRAPSCAMRRASSRATC
jgi:hypothetical protein